MLSKLVDVFFGVMISRSDSCKPPLCCSARIGVTETSFELVDEVSEVDENRRGCLSCCDGRFIVSELLCLTVSPY